METSRPTHSGGLLGYMYTLYITYARADDLSQTKRGSSEGALCTKKGVLRGPKWVQMDPSGSLLESIPKWSHT